jgi:hypothetical protein
MRVNNLEYLDLRVSALSILTLNELLDDIVDTRRVDSGGGGQAPRTLRRERNIGFIDWRETNRNQQGYVE